MLRVATVTGVLHALTFNRWKRFKVIVVVVLLTLGVAALSIGFGSPLGMVGALVMALGGWYLIRGARGAEGPTFFTSREKRMSSGRLIFLGLGLFAVGLTLAYLGFEVWGYSMWGVELG